MSPDTDLVAYRRFTTRTHWHSVARTGMDLVVKTTESMQCCIYCSVKKIRFFIMLLQKLIAVQK